MNYNFKKIMISLCCIAPLATIASDQEKKDRDARNAALMLKIYPVVQKLDVETFDKKSSVWQIIQEFNPEQLSDGFAMDQVFPLQAPDLYNTTNANIVRFSPNESQVAIVKNKKVLVEDVNTGDEIASFDHDTMDPITEVNFSVDGMLLLTCCKNIIRIWNIKKKDLVASIAPDCKTFSNASFSSAGDQIAVETNVGVQVFQTSSGKHLKTFYVSSNGKTYGAKYYQWTETENGILIEHANGKKERYGVVEKDDSVAGDDEYKKKGAQTKKVIFTKLADLNADYVVQKDNRQPPFQLLNCNQYTDQLSIDVKKRSYGCEGAIRKFYNSRFYYHPFAYIRYKDRDVLRVNRDINNQDINNYDRSSCYFISTGKMVVKAEYEGRYNDDPLPEWVGRYKVSDVSLVTDETFAYYANGNLMSDQELLLLLLKDEENSKSYSDESPIDLDALAQKKCCDVAILKSGLNRFPAIFKNKIVEVYKIYTEEQKADDLAKAKAKKDSAICLLM